MATRTQAQLQPPLKNKIHQDGFVERAWGVFFSELERRLSPYGVEKYAELSNNQIAAANVDGLVFNKAKVGAAFVDYLIQRVTTGVDATELIEVGTFEVCYRPTSDDWVIYNDPISAGVTLTITATGQIQYTSSIITGTASISKLTYRARTLAAKNSEYSEAG